MITINAGNIRIVSSDDGINVAAGGDGSGTMQAPGGQQGPSGQPGQDTVAYSGNYYLYIHGGTIVVEAAGDGLDINGAIEMTGGVLLVNGPTEQMNGAIDYDASFKITGGLVVAAGSSGMAMTADASSSQPSILVYFPVTQPAGTLVHIQNNTGEDLITYAPSKEFQSIAVSSPGIVNGGTYTIYTGGSSTGRVNDGLYVGGTYAPGVRFTSFTVSTIVTTVGTGGMGGLGGGPLRRP